MKGTWTRNLKYSNNYEFREKPGDGYVIDLWFHSDGGKRHEVVFIPLATMPAVPIPGHIVTLSQAQAWAVAVWRTMQ